MAIYVFRSARKTNLVEDVEILLLATFRQIPFNGFREEVVNVSANQRPGRPSLFSNVPPPKKKKKNPTNLVEDVEILLPDKSYYFQRPSVYKLTQLLSTGNVTELCNVGKFIKFAFNERKTM